MQPVDIKILLADDNPATLAALAGFLTGAGYRCLPSRGGAAAFRTFRERGADLVVTDLNMAGGDGYTLVHRVRDVSPVPVLMISGVNPSYARQRVAEEFGGDDNIAFLAKPFDRAAFLAKVASLLGRGAPGVDAPKPLPVPLKAG